MGEGAKGQANKKQLFTTLPTPPLAPPTNPEGNTYYANISLHHPRGNAFSPYRLPDWEIVRR